MAEKIHDRYKVITYLTSDQLTELDDYAKKMGMSRSATVGMMITSYLIQEELISKTKSMDDMLDKMKELTQLVKEIDKDAEQ